MHRLTIVSGVALALSMLVQSAHASDGVAADMGVGSDVAAADGDAAAGSPASSSEIVVTAHKLNAARASIQPALGASSYEVTNATIQALPGGDNQQLNDVLLQVPGVVQDGFGQFHVRGDHGNLQYRINGTILPEGIATFGQTLSPRLIESFRLLTGALPAQYGLRTAGVVDITTKSGFKNGGTLSVYGGSHGTIVPSVEYGGSSGRTNYFVSGEYRHNQIGIESVDGSRSPLHDDTDQAHLFAYVDHILDDSNRVSLLGGYSNQWFQIPNPRGLHPTAGWDVGGVTDFLSDDLNERQLQRTGYGQLAWLHDAGDVTLEAALFARYSSLHYRPDVLGELLFNGLAQAAFKSDLALGGQFDAVWHANDTNIIRAGLYASHDRSRSRTTTQLFPVDADGNQTGQPISIADNGADTQWVLSFYLQDELKLSSQLTLNFGGRFDYYDAYRSENQFSPRVNLVWQPASGTTVHAGYARYFSPPPFELVTSGTLQAFAGTSGAPASFVNTTPYAERQHYFDIGFEQKLGNAISFGVDAYYRISKNLIDEGQFGAPIILTPFNYADGRIRGVEFNLSYSKGPWLAYGSFAVSRAQGRNIISSQFSFDPADLAYIRDNYIHLDHDQTYSGSAGVSFTPRSGSLTGLQLGADMIYGSGLRTDGDVPNGGKLPPYAQVNLSASYTLAGPGVQLRFDVINVGDHVYAIRDGSGVGVGAPQFGPRRGFFVGISKHI